MEEDIKSMTKLLEATYEDGNIRIESNGAISRLFINGEEIERIHYMKIEFKPKCLPTLHITKVIIPKKEIEA